MKDYGYKRSIYDFMDLLCTEISQRLPIMSLYERIAAVPCDIKVPPNEGTNLVNNYLTEMKATDISLCLLGSLTLFWLYKDIGAVLHLGSLKSQTNRYTFHSWVTLQGRFLLENQDPNDFYTVIIKLEGKNNVLTRVDAEKVYSNGHFIRDNICM